MLRWFPLANVFLIEFDLELVVPWASNNPTSSTIDSIKWSSSERHHNYGRKSKTDI